MTIFIRWAPVAIFSCPFVKTLQVFTSAVIAKRVLIALFILLNSNLSQDYAVRLFFKDINCILVPSVCQYNSLICCSNALLAMEFVFGYMYVYFKQSRLFSCKHFILLFHFSKRMLPVTSGTPESDLFFLTTKLIEQTCSNCWGKSRVQYTTSPP